jgi:chloride channel 3/4/5
LTGAFFIRQNVQILLLKSKNEFLKRNPIWWVAILVTITSILNYSTIFSRIDGVELIESLFLECTEKEHLGLCDITQKPKIIFSLFSVMIIKIVTAIFSVGPPLPGGVFLPSMIWGALFGRILGEVVEIFHLEFPNFWFFSQCHLSGPCVIPGMYALLGAIGSFGGVTKLTVSLTVLMFELTGTPNYVIPCMITLATAKLVGDYFEANSNVSVMIKTKGFPYLDPNRELLTDAMVSEKMTVFADLICLYNGITLGRIENILLDTDYSGYPIIKAKGENQLIGYLSRIELEHCLEKSILGDMDDNTQVAFKENWSNYPGRNLCISQYVDHLPFCVEYNSTIEFVFELFKKMGTRYCFVESNGELLGLLTKKDLLAFDEALKIDEDPHQLHIHTPEDIEEEPLLE